MTEINWGDGLSFDEVLELAYRINIDSVLSPELHARIQQGINAGMKMAPVVQKMVPVLQNVLRTMPWLAGLLHIDSGDLGDFENEDFNAIIDVLTLVKRLFDT